MIEFQRLQQINNGKIQNLWAFISQKKEFSTEGTEGKKYTANVNLFDPSNFKSSLLANVFIKQATEDFRDFTPSLNIHSVLRNAGLNVVDYYLANRTTVITPFVGKADQLIIDKSANLNYLGAIINGRNLKKEFIKQLYCAHDNGLYANGDGLAITFNRNTRLGNLLFLDLTSGFNRITNKWQRDKQGLNLLITKSFMSFIPDTEQRSDTSFLPSGKRVRSRVFSMLGEQLRLKGIHSEVDINDYMELLETSETSVRRAVYMANCSDVVNSHIVFRQDISNSNCRSCALYHDENDNLCPIRQKANEIKFNWDK